MNVCVLQLIITIKYNYNIFLWKVFSCMMFLHGKLSVFFKRLFSYINFNFISFEFNHNTYSCN